MKLEWQSVEEIEDEFDLGSVGDDLRELRRQLRARLIEVHPDRTEGAFGSEGEESDFHRIKSAIEFVDKRLLTSMPQKNDQALMVATQFSEVIAESMNRARQKDHDLERARQLHDRQRLTAAEIDSEVRKKYRVNKITAGIIAAFFCFLTLAPETFEQNPVFRSLSGVVEKLDFTLGVLFLYLFIASAAAILYLAWEEQRELKRKKECLSDKGVEQIIKSKAFEGRLGPLGKFTRSDLICALEDHRISRDQNTLNEIAGLFIEKLILRGAAKRIEKPSLNEVYELDFGIYLEIRPDKV